MSYTKTRRGILRSAGVRKCFFTAQQKEERAVAAAVPQRHRWYAVWAAVEIPWGRDETTSLAAKRKTQPPIETSRIPVLRKHALIRTQSYEFKSLNRALLSTFSSSPFLLCAYLSPPASYSGPLVCLPVWFGYHLRSTVCTTDLQQYRESCPHSPGTRSPGQRSWPPLGSARRRRSNTCRCHPRASLLRPPRRVDTLLGRP